MTEGTTAETTHEGVVDVSVVIVSWNVRELLRGCLESLRHAETAPSLQIIVVDNASDDGSQEAVQTGFPQVELVACQANLGFSRASNLGLRLAKGRYILFLNPDTVLHTDALNRLAALLDTNHDVDLVGPKIVSPDGTPQWIAARRPPSAAQLSFQALYLHRLPMIGPRLLNRMTFQYDLNKSQEVEAISGAAMFGRRSAVEAVGGFDESFLFTGEDMDLCERMRIAGSKIFYLPEATVVHYGGQSSARAWGRTGAMGVLSTERYLTRAHGRARGLMFRLIVQFVQMPIMLLVGVGKALFRRTGPGGLRQRLTYAKAVWRWRIDD
jgi:GT2 family glycosyltransferase